MTTLKLIVFDVDGTLVDSQAHIVSALDAMYQAGKRPTPDRQRLLSIVGLSLNEAISHLEPDLPESSVEDWAAEYRAHFIRERQVSAPPPLYPGALDAIDRLGSHENVLLGVATGKARRGLDHILDAYGLQKRFATLQTSDLHPSKPNPAMLLAALGDAGVEAGEAVMVGDTTFDIEMARAAGMPSIGVNWGYHKKERLEAAGASRLLSRFDELDEAVSELIGDLS